MASMTSKLSLSCFLAFSTEETGMRPLQLASKKQKVLERIVQEKDIDKKAIDLIVEKEGKVDMVAAKADFKAMKKRLRELKDKQKQEAVA